MMDSLKRLRQFLGEIQDVKHAASVLSWDQETYMPPGGVESRASQLATLHKLAHEKFVSDEIRRLLDEVGSEIDAGDESSEEARLVAVVRRDFERATRIPSDLVARFTKTTARATQVWREARARSDFDLFAPHLQDVVALTKEKAEALGYERDIYDPLLDEFEPGMTTAEVAGIFSEVRRQLVPIVAAIEDRHEISNDVLRGHFDHRRQWDFGVQVITAFGYDFARGRQDESAHPFTIHFGHDDVRITTCIHEDFISPALFGTLHECGHALYEQGVSENYFRSPLAEGTSLGMHESQSRLWENLVGRGKAFWQHYYPVLIRSFPDHFGSVPLDEFYRAINRVKPSLIRIEADEVTYNLHIMVRFELERELLTGALAVRELPEAWNEKMSSYLGVTPESDDRGVLQDIHWSIGIFGYFPTYALGNLMSTQIFDQARLELEDLEGQIALGRFDDLRNWLREKIYRHGRSLTATEILGRVTGGVLDSGNWLNYIRSKFGELYGPLP